MSEENNMSQRRPNVFPDKDLISQANQTGDEIAKQFEEENNYNPHIGDGERRAAEEMARKTQQQIEERTRLMQEQIDKANKLEEERKVMMSQQRPERHNPMQPPIPPTPPRGDNPSNGGSNQPEEYDRLKSLSQKQLNDAYDVIPLPSEGKLYKNVKKSIKVAYLTAADENILSNPNLMESGEFLEILMNRKILEPNLTYSDLHVGDRNAIMIWLRATAYGHEYPIEVTDPETYDTFEHIVDLSTIKTIKLGAEPNSEGLFEFILPVTKTPIKFKLLTVGEVDAIDEHIDNIKTSLGPEFADGVTHTLSKQVVEVDGNNDRSFIDKFVQTMRAGDSRGLRKYIDEIESGVDMRLDITTPGDGSIRPFLPFNLNFFWP